MHSIFESLCNCEVGGKGRTAPALKVGSEFEGFDVIFEEEAGHRGSRSW